MIISASFRKKTEKICKRLKKRQISICQILAEELRKIPQPEHKGYVFHNKNGISNGKTKKAIWYN